MKLLNLSLVLILLIACGEILEKLDDIKDKGDERRQHNSTDAAFSTYVSTFETEARAYLSDTSFSVGDIPINFGDTEGNAVGVCYSYSNGQKEIIIHKGRWEASPSLREVLIFHELGHCRLGRGHDNALADGVVGNDKLSILNEYLVSGHEYTQYRDAYLKELFLKDKTDITASLSN